MRVFLLVVCSFVAFSDAIKTMPEYLQKYLCSRSDKEIAKCLLKSYEEARPLLLKGIPELNIPAADPFLLPAASINRTINDLVRITGSGKNIKVTGASKAVIEDFKADIDTFTGEARFFIPKVTLEMEYDVNGQLLVVPMRSSGFFFGNFSDIRIFIRSNIKTYTKKGVDYYKFGKIFLKFTVGDGHIRMVEKDPQLQYAANLIADFYNEDPQRTLEAIYPIAVDTGYEFIRLIGDNILGQLPASEWLKE